MDLPAVGRVKKRWVYLPAGLAAAYVAYRWYVASQAPAEEPAASDGLYTSEDLSGYGLSTTGGATSITGNTGSTVTDATGDALDDNAEWTQAVVERLGNAGYDSATVYAALGEFLARRALDKTEASIARAALAAAGQPPVGGPYYVVEEASTDSGTLAAPTGLRVTGAGTQSVTLSWSAVTGAAYYQVYRSGAAANAVKSNAASATIYGLAPNTSYTFQVAAVGSTGKTGAKSAPVTGKTDPVKLGKPSGLKSSAITRSSFRVSCNRVPGATYYRWELNGRPAGASDQPYRDFTGLKAGTTYSVTVTADTTNQAPGPESGALKVTTKK